MTYTTVESIINRNELNVKTMVFIKALDSNVVFNMMIIGDGYSQTLSKVNFVVEKKHSNIHF